MKKLFFPALMLFCAVLSAQMSSPLEVPEKPGLATLRTDAGKLARVSGKKVLAESFGICADGKELPVSAADLKGDDGLTLLQFEIPANTKKLSLLYGEKKNSLQKPGGKDLLKGILAGKWTCGNAWFKDRKFKPDPKKSYGKITSSNGRLTLELPDTDSVASCCFSADAAIPSGMGGDAVFVTDFKVKNPQPFNFELHLSQFDEKGNDLHTSVVSPRNLVLTLPGNKNMRMRQDGRIDPRTRKIRVTVKLLRACWNPWPPLEKDGSVSRDLSSWLPKVEFFRMELYPGSKIVFPTHNPERFTEGVLPGTKALALDGKTGLLINFNPPAVTQDSFNPGRDEEFHFPSKQGTVEFFFRPGAWNRKLKATTLFSTCDDGFAPVISYDANKKELVLSGSDAKNKRFEKRAKAGVALNTWHHLALVWDPANGCSLFLDGKKILDHQSKLASISYQKKAFGDFKPGIGSFAYNMNHYFGTNDAVMKALPFFQGAADKLRISDIVRYTEDFTPEKKISCDKNTRSFFDFEHDYFGTHAESDRFVFASLMTASSPWADDLVIVENGKSRKVSWNPKAYPESMNYAKTLPNWLDSHVASNIPKTKDFQTGRVLEKAAKTMKNGDRWIVRCGKTMIFDSLCFSVPRDGKSVANIFLHRKGDVDLTSFKTMRDTLGADCRSDQEKANALFRFLVKSTEYFMFHPAWILPSNYAARMYHVHTWPASCIGFECGQLNEFGWRTFLNVLDLPVARIAGTGHCIMQVFYDGKWHIWDLSAQQPFANRDGKTESSFEETESDPYLLARLRGRVPSHYILWGRRGPHNWSGSYRYEPNPLTLHPGESFKASNFNNGMSNDLIDRNMINECMEASGLTGLPKGRVYRIPFRNFPEYGTGIFLFEGTPLKTNPAFKFEKDSFTYEVKSPYMIVGSEIKVPAGTEIGIATDFRNHFTKLPKSKDGVYKIDYLIRARSRYLVKVHAPAEKTAFSCRTFVQLNERIFPGRLEAGENALAMSSSGGALNVEARWLEDAKKIVLEGGVPFGYIRGAEKQIFVMKPGTELAIRTQGLSPEAKFGNSGRLEMRLAGHTLFVRAPAGTKALVHAFVQDGKIRKEFSILVMENARLAFPEKGVSRKEISPVSAVRHKADYRFEKIPAGKYAWFALTKDNNTFWAEKGHFNLHNAHFFLKNFGRDKLFVWNYPATGGYPYRGLKIYDFKETDRFTVTVQYGKLVSAWLIIPADDILFAHEVRTFLTGLNNNQAHFIEEI